MTNHVKRLLAETDLHAIARYIAEQEKQTSGQIRVSIRQSRARNERGRSIEELARKEFHALGMAKTAERSGVLIFLLLEDRKFKEGILHGVKSVAAELSRHFPYKPGGKNELPDTVHVR